VTIIDKPNFIELSWAWHDENDIRGHQSQVRFEVLSNPAGGTQFRLIHSGLESQMSSQNWSVSLALSAKIAHLFRRFPMLLKDKTAIIFAATGAVSQGVAREIIFISRVINPPRPLILPKP